MANPDSRALFLADAKNEPDVETRSGPILALPDVPLKTGPKMGRLAGAHLAYAQAALRPYIAGLEYISEAVLEDWLTYLSERFADMCRQTTVLEFNIAQLSDPSLDIDVFLSSLTHTRNRASVFADYPVLKRRLDEVLVQQIENFRTFLARFTADWPKVRRSFSLPHSTRLSHLDFGSGDQHNDGQTVIIATLETGQKLVYKPREIAIEQGFNELLAELNRQISSLSFRQTKFVPGQDYGWVEFISAESCTTEAELHSYFRHTGGLLALTHILGGFDFHHENLIAAGPDPVMIDLETLFYSFKNGTYLGLQDPFLEASEFPAVKALLGSVITTLMLPQNARDEQISGIDGLARSQNVAQRYNIEKNVVEPSLIGEALHFNAPRLKGEVVKATDYSGDIAAGFRLVYKHFMARKDHYCAPDSPVRKLAQCRARVVVRDTKIYHKLVQNSYHPTLLQSEDARLVHFLNLWHHAEKNPTTIPLFASEVRQLLRDDIPYFCHHPIAPEVLDYSGTPTRYAYDTTGLDTCLAAIKDLSEKDLALQEWIIIASLETGVRAPKPLYERTSSDRPPALHEALDKVHDAIMFAALADEQMLDWLTITPTPDEKLIVAPVDITFYSGIAGLVYYLAYYAAFTKDPADRKNAEMALANMHQQLEDDWQVYDTPGAMAGLGGAAYTYLHLSALWQQPSFVDKAFHILERDLQNQQINPELFDIIGGAAGLVCVALVGYETSGQKRFLALAETFADILLGAAKTDDHGKYWALGENAHPLTGFSHGWSGIAYALSWLAKHSSRTGLQSEISHILMREHKDFLPEAGNWRDWRLHNMTENPSENHNDFGYFWCNGSAGIGLSRIGMLATGQTDPLLKADIEVAAHTTLSHGLGHNHSLCHGDMGNLDFLMQAATLLQDRALESACLSSLGQSCETILEGRIFGGSSRRVAPPDLMTGLSGVAYGLLRFLAPDTMPDLMLLKGPLK